MFSRLMLSTLLFCTLGSLLSAQESKPNVLWIYVDDMSDWLGCYGDELADTPHIDGLARDGILFENAFVPSPVCSTTRSAIITGAMQTTHGLHQHRTMRKQPLPESIQTVAEIFQQAGYTTFNESKEDYNFLRPRDRLYSSDFERPRIKGGHWKGEDLTWLEQLQGKPFFGQIQLAGGKFGGETGSKYPAESRLSADSVSVPPQYPDDPVLRNAIARHYEQIAITDAQVGQILQALEEYQLRDNTILFFFTDHGSPLPRSKQFLYDEGVKVPLIVAWKGGEDRFNDSSTRRRELVSGLDIPAISLGLAGLPIPDTFEGKNVFAPEYVGPSYVVSARDRCGIAVDRIRSIRSQRLRYIKNFKTDRALYQSQYRDKYATFSQLRELLSAGKLTALQASYHEASQRPEEELYDLERDPHQVRNLAQDPAYTDDLQRHRRYLEQWIRRTGDLGQYPEDQDSLKAVYDGAKGKVEAPEFDFLR